MVCNEADTKGSNRKSHHQKSNVYCRDSCFNHYFFLLVIGGAINTLFSENPSASGTGDGIGTCGQLINVPEKVQKYRGIVEKELEKQGFTKDYTNCMIAQIMQESGGNPPDVFQASESKYGKIGMIDSVEESVEQGVKRWKEIKKQIESKDFPLVLICFCRRITSAKNYLDWLDKTNQQYSLDTAFEYSSMFYEKLKSQGIYRCHFLSKRIRRVTETLCMYPMLNVTFQILQLILQ